ncbi:MAG: L,D-transpeptidase [Desulfobaccales bacterium]
MTNWTRILACLLALLCLLARGGAVSAQQEDYSHFCDELKNSGLEIVDSGVAYGVPFVRVRIPQGSSITAICGALTAYDSQFESCRNRLAFFNALNPSYIKTTTEEPNSITANTLKIPLDLRMVPEVFSEHKESLEAYEKYLLVDVGKGFLALYANGDLQRVFPISAGVSGKRTPLTDFRIEDKDENHWSSIYDSWMPWALHVEGPYYIHGGVLPGKADSHGCVRLRIADAKKLYKLVEVGTPGRIIDTPKADRDIYPAPFCRGSEAPGPVLPEGAE